MWLKLCKWTQTLMLLKAHNIHFPSLTRHQPSRLGYLLRTSSHYHQSYFSMSSRRSARLSAALSLAQTDVKLPNDSPSPKLANISKKRKNTSKDAPPAANGDDSGPLTPKRKRAVKPAAPPVTPTPSAVGLMSSPYNDRSMPPPAIPRLAVPNGTNATLVTPETHRVVTSKPIDQVSPSKKSKSTTTTGNILEEALAHLIKVEPKLKPIIERHPCNVFSPEGLAEEIDPFNSLISGIISQQV